MIKLIIKVAVIFLAVIFQVTLMPLLAIKGSIPNLILVSALVLVLISFKDDALLTAAIGGLLFDFLSPIRFGLNTIIFISLVLLLDAISKRYFPAISILIISLVVFSGTLIYGIFMNLILKSWLGWQIPIEGFYAILIALIFFFSLSHFLKSPKSIKVEL